MHIIKDILVFFLGGYLAFTNFLAVEISSLLTPGEIAQKESVSQELINIESKIRFGDIPDILIKNAAYQKAAIVESITPEAAPGTALDALVNIFCSYTTNTYTKTTTGTGFVIDTKGVVLTNAHIAQFLLLEGLQGDTKCTIRTGNPAIAMYEADLLYISPAWVREHARSINEEAPTGTGERDYALLYITSVLNDTTDPDGFVALPFNQAVLTLDSLNTEVLATGYPAKFILDNGIHLPLIPKQATTTIGELMTFGSNLVDIFTIRGSTLGEHGSSGSPVVDAQGKAIGMISTRGDDARFGNGSLRAISISYIDRTITEETGFSLTQNLGGNLPYRAQLFKETIIPFLQKEIQGEL